jgi:hypothetical protein
MGSSRKGEVEPSAAIETRLLPWAVTFTTGVRPRRPQVRPLGGLRPWPDSSSKQSQAPRSAAVLLSRAGLLPPRGDGGRLVPLDGPAGRDLDAPADPVVHQLEVQGGAGGETITPLAGHLLTVVSAYKSRVSCVDPFAAYLRLRTGQ